MDSRHIESTLKWLSIASEGLANHLSWRHEQQIEANLLHPSPHPEAALHQERRIHQLSSFDGILIALQRACLGLQEILSEHAGALSADGVDLVCVLLDRAHQSYLRTVRAHGALPNESVHHAVTFLLAAQPDLSRKYWLIYLRQNPTQDQELGWIAIRKVEQSILMYITVWLNITSHLITGCANLPLGVSDLIS